MSNEKKLKNDKIEEKTAKTVKKSKEKTANRSFVSGNYSLGMTVIVLAILIVMNVIVTSIPEKYTQYDVSATDIFTLSDTTKEFLATLEEDITIYEIAEIQNENDYVKNIVQAYVNESKHIKFERIDPALDPQFLEDLGVSVSQGSVIVMKGERFKECEISGMFLNSGTEDTDSTSSDTSSSTTTAEANGETYDQIDIEGQITGAIAYVNVETLPIVYQLTGHEEAALEDFMITEINKQAIELKTLDLQEEGKIPDDIGMLMINGMQSDFTDEEYELIKAYMEEGGRIFWLTTPSYDVGTDMSNYHKLMKEYGVDAQEGCVLEQNEGYMPDSTRPMEIYPVLKRHDITREIDEADKKVLMAMADSIEILEDGEREGLTVESIIQSSDSGYFKQKDSAVMTKLVTDEEGVFHLGVAITDQVTEEKQAKIVLLSSYTVTAEYYDEMVNGANTQLVIGAMSWLADQEIKTEVPVKNLYPDDLVLTQEQVTKTTIAVVIILPAVVLIYGLSVMIRRRKR